MSRTHRKKPFTTVQSCRPGEPCILCQRRVGITVGRCRDEPVELRTEHLEHELAAAKGA